MIVEREFDAAINELEERTRRLKEPPRTSNLQDKLLGEVDSLHNQIVNLHKVNDDRTQLIQILDNRDTDLRAQHVELQQKLCELQNKKIQVDRLASQLHGMDEVEEGDVGESIFRFDLFRFFKNKSNRFTSEANCYNERSIIEIEGYA